MEMTKCVNCGAEIESSIVKCPFCGYLNEAGAKKAHQQTIDNLEYEISDNLNESKEAYSKGIRATGKSSAFGIGIVLLIAGILALMSFIFWRFFDKGNVSQTEERSIGELAFQETNFDTWDEMQKNGQYDELVKLYEKADEEGHNLFAYASRDFLYTYSLYDKLKSEELPKLDNNTAKSKDKEAITYYALVFYYRGYGNVTDEQRSVLDDIRDNYMLDIIYNRLCITDDELAKIQPAVQEAGGGLVVRSTLGFRTMKFYDRYN